MSDITPPNKLSQETMARETHISLVAFAEFRIKNRFFSQIVLKERKKADANGELKDK